MFVGSTILGRGFLRISLLNYCIYTTHSVIAEKAKLTLTNNDAAHVKIKIYAITI